MLSRYSALAASSRYRTMQYLPYLQSMGFEITEQVLLEDNYLQTRMANKPMSPTALLRSYAHRLEALWRAGSYDLIWLEKEFLPWVPQWAVAPLTRAVPYVVDYDDAVFHNYDMHRSPIVRAAFGRQIDHVMHDASLVIAGNSYLVARARQAGAPRIEELPTVIDLERYPLVPKNTQRDFTIGWIGSPYTAKYLAALQPVLQEFCREGGVRVLAIGSGDLAMEGVPLEVRPWAEATEVADMRAFDVGIMPLSDTPWEQGKCGFKLIQYMGVACPVVGSPIGINREIIQEGVNGFQATTPAEWIRAFQALRDDITLRERMGQAGRRIVEERYCLQVTAPRLERLFRQILKV